MIQSAVLSDCTLSSTALTIPIVSRFPGREELVDHRIGQAIHNMGGGTEIVSGGVAVRDRNRDGPRGGCGFGTRFAVFENHHLMGADPQAFRRLEIDIGFRFTSLDIFGGESFVKAFQQGEPIEDILHVVSGRRSRYGFGHVDFFEMVKQLEQPLHRFQVFVHQSEEYFVGFGDQSVDFFADSGELEHVCDRFGRPASEHRVADFVGHPESSTLEEFVARNIEHILGVEHQTVEIENYRLDRHIRDQSLTGMLRKLLSRSSIGCRTGMFFPALRSAA